MKKKRIKMKKAKEITEPKPPIIPSIKNELRTEGRPRWVMPFPSRVKKPSTISINGVDTVKVVLKIRNITKKNRGNAVYLFKTKASILSVFWLERVAL